MCRIAILTVALAVAGPACPADPPSAEEPTHDGKTVGQWVEQL